MSSRRIRRDASGNYEIRLGEEERILLSRLPGQLIEALSILEDSWENSSDNDNENSPYAQEIVPEELRRLFPVAYPRDDEAESTYGSLTRPDLARSHRRALETLSKTARSIRLDSEGLESWLKALNSLRLVLGTDLDITEESDPVPASDPRHLEWEVYGYLSGLLDEIVSVLCDDLPPAIPGAGNDLIDDPWGEPPGGLRWDGTALPEPGEQ